MELPANYEKCTGKQRRLIREEYVRVQDNLCQFCHEPLDGPCAKEVADKKVKRMLFPLGFFVHPIHLHHSHDTGMTIGAVHCYCNAVLWQYHDE